MFDEKRELAQNTDGYIVGIWFIQLEISYELGLTAVNCCNARFITLSKFNYLAIINSIIKLNNDI